MPGYLNDYSMSVNASMAYGSGEMPRSKWTKAAILSALEEQEAAPELIARAAKLPVAALRDLLLISCGWHHTSSWYNKTDFYEVCADHLTPEALTARENKPREKRQAVKPAAEAPVFRKVSYLVWSGSRNHPKSERFTETCEIKGNWALTSHGKKSVSANGFQFLEDNA